VAIAPAGFPDRSGRNIQLIGIAYNGSKQARHALDEATALAQIAHASVRLIVVVDPPTDDAVRAVSSVGFSVATHAHGRRLNAQAKLDDAIASLPASVDATGVLVEGDAAEAVAAQEVDLLLCGSRAYGTVGSVMLGSTSRPLVTQALAPVIVIPRTPPDPSSPLAAPSTSRIACRPEGRARCGLLRRRRGAGCVRVGSVARRPRGPARSPRGRR
jgi:nucleotide-binding universal stress UspA family protein